MSWAAQSLPGFSAAQLTLELLVAWAKAGLAMATAASAMMERGMRRMEASWCLPGGCHGCVRIGRSGAHAWGWARICGRSWCWGPGEGCADPIDCAHEEVGNLPAEIFDHTLALVS